MQKWKAQKMSEKNEKKKCKQTYPSIIQSTLIQSRFHSIHQQQYENKTKNSYDFLARM